MANLDPAKEIACADKARPTAGLRYEHKLVDLLQVAGLARSVFYYQCKASQRADQHNEMEARIRTADDERQDRNGYRRVTAALCNSIAQPVN